MGRATGLNSARKCLNLLTTAALINLINSHVDMACIIYRPTLIL